MYAVGVNSLTVFVPKYHLKGLVHLVDLRGLVIPPLDSAGQDLAAPAEVVRRRNLHLRTGLCPAIVNFIAEWFCKEEVKSKVKHVVNL